MYSLFCTGTNARAVPPGAKEKGQPKTCPFRDYPPYPIHTKNTNTSKSEARMKEKKFSRCIHTTYPTPVSFSIAFVLFFSNPVPVRVLSRTSRPDLSSGVEQDNRFV
jgi:hypothetical protein